MLENIFLDEKTAHDIDTRVAKTLRDIGDPEPPLCLELVRELLELDKGTTRVARAECSRKQLTDFKVAGKQVLRRPGRLWDVVKKFDLKARWGCRRCTTHQAAHHRNGNDEKRPMPRTLTSTPSSCNCRSAQAMGFNSNSAIFKSRRARRLSAGDQLLLHRASPGRPLSLRNTIEPASEARITAWAPVPPVPAMCCGWPWPKRPMWK